MTSAEHTSRPQTTRLSVDDDNMHDGDSQHSPKEDEISARSTTKRRRALAWIKAVYHNQFSWISGNMSLRSWKPVIRSAIAAWVSLLTRADTSPVWRAIHTRSCTILLYPIPADQPPSDCRADIRECSGTGILSTSRHCSSIPTK